MHRLRLLVPVCLLGATAPAVAVAAASHAVFWTALGGNIACGVAIHTPGSPPTQVLCSARPVPAPKGHGIGDPGFVFLGSAGRPSVARLSQDSFVGTRPIGLAAGRKWRSGSIGVTCTTSARAVRCVNRSHHGFRITRSAYRAF